MNFYKRKFVFVSLICCVILITFFLLSTHREIKDESIFYPIETVSSDTTGTTEVTAKMIREEEENKEENIILKDHGSPKTVNFILYLIYRFTFKHVN